MLSSFFTTNTPQDDPFGIAKPKLEQPTTQSLRAHRSLTADLHTPHDAALSELFQQPSERKENNLAKASIFDPYRLAGAHTREPIRDPFDGQHLGSVVLPDPILHPEAHRTLSNSANRNEDIWSHLSPILDLQSQIAVLHLEMEGIGASNHGKGKSKGGVDRAANNGSRPPVRTASGTAELLDLEHDEGVGVGEDENEEEKKDREREEDFAKLALQFEERKEGVDVIMSKLDDLSKALTGFHALQAPSIKFPSSRHNSNPISSPTAYRIQNLSVLLPGMSPPNSPSHGHSRSATILNSSRILDSPDSAKSHEFR